MRTWTLVGCGLCVWMTMSASAEGRIEADSLPRRGGATSALIDAIWNSFARSREGPGFFRGS
jgi:hypothetical protein